MTRDNGATVNLVDARERQRDLLTRLGEARDHTLLVRHESVYGGAARALQARSLVTITSWSPGKWGQDAVTLIES
jgi:hypothetical protein